MSMHDDIAALEEEFGPIPGGPVPIPDAPDIPRLARTAASAVTMAAEAAKAAVDAAKPQPKKKEPVPREVTFPVTWEHPFTGQVYNTVLTSVVMDGDELGYAAVTAAQLSGGVPWESLHPDSRLRFTALGTVQWQIRKPPEWFMTAASIDFRLLVLVYNRCCEHTRGCFRDDAGEGPGAQGQRRLVVGEIAPAKRAA